MKSRDLVPLMVMASALYLAYLTRFYVGFFNDDASYILAAQSLLHGQFRQLSSPDHPIIHLILPGYPLFLAPFVILFSPHWAWLKATTIGLTLCSGLLLWELWSEQPRHWKLLLVGFFLLNPTVALYSGSVMSDPFYSFSVLLLFVLLKKTLTRREERYPWVLGLGLAWSCLTRPIGGILLVSILTGLACERRMTSALRSLGLAILILATYFLTTFWLSHSTNSYLHQWQGSLPYLLHNPSLWFHNLVDVLRCFFAGGLLAISISSTRVLGNSLITLTATLCLAFIIVGWRKEMKRKTLPVGVLTAMGVWTVLYICVHSLWTALDYRYALPLIPLALPFLLTGATILRPRWAAPRVYAIGLVGVLLSSYSVLHARLLSETWSTDRPAESLLPTQTYQWIKAAVPADATLISKTESMFLYTQRHSVGCPAAADLEEFRYQLMRLHVTYIFFSPGAVMEVHDLNHSAEYRWSRALAWTTHRPDQFFLLYQNDTEQTAIYEVRADTSFFNSYKQSLQAEQNLRAGRQKEAEDELTEALRLDPVSIHALNEMGSLLLSTGRFAKAENLFQKAYRLQPAHPLTNLNLAMLYEKTGRRREALPYLLQCEISLQGTPELTLYKPIIDEETRKLSIYS